MDRHYSPSERHFSLFGHTRANEDCLTFQTNWIKQVATFNAREINITKYEVFLQMIGPFFKI